MKSDMLKDLKFMISSDEQEYFDNVKCDESIVISMLREEYNKLEIIDDFSIWHKNLVERLTVYKDRYFSDEEFDKGELLCRIVCLRKLYNILDSLCQRKKS